MIGELRKQVRASFLNPKAGYTNDMVFYLSEYNQRAKLRKLGFTESLEELDALTGELFAMISDEIDKLESEEAKNRRKRGK